MRAIIKPSRYSRTIISAQDYPYILVTTGCMTQSAVLGTDEMGCENARVQTDNHLLLFKTDMESGHGGASGRFKSLQEKALEFNFFLHTLAEDEHQ